MKAPFTTCWDVRNSRPGPIPNAVVVWVDRSGHVEPVDSSWQVNTGGTLQRRRDRDEGWGFALSPDGRRIALTLLTDLGTDIWISSRPRYRCHGSRSHAGEDRAPAWTPDGKRSRSCSDRPIARGRREVRSRSTLWEQTGGWHRRTATFSAGDTPSDAFPSPDGRWLVLGASRIAGASAPAVTFSRRSREWTAWRARSWPPDTTKAARRCRRIRVGSRTCRTSRGERGVRPAVPGRERRQVASLERRWQRAALGAQRPRAVLRQRRKDECRPAPSWPAVLGRTAARAVRNTVPCARRIARSGARLRSRPTISDFSWCETRAGRTWPGRLRWWWWRTSSRSCGRSWSHARSSLRRAIHRIRSAPRSVNFVTSTPTVAAPAPALVCPPWRCTTQTAPPDR